MAPVQVRAFALAAVAAAVLSGLAWSHPSPAGSLRSVEANGTLWRTLATGATSVSVTPRPGSLPGTHFAGRVTDPILRATANWGVAILSQHTEIIRAERVLPWARAALRRADTQTDLKQRRLLLLYETTETGCCTLELSALSAQAGTATMVLTHLPSCERCPQPEGKSVQYLLASIARKGLPIPNRFVVTAVGFPGSESNPFPLGQTNGPGGAASDNAWTINVHAVNENAWAEVQAANATNSEPKLGDVDVLINLQLHFGAPTTGQITNLTNYLTVIGPSNASYGANDSCGVLPSPTSTDYSSIAPDAHFSLNLCWQVASADAGHLELEYSYFDPAFWALY